jgi:hypothetical protein
MLSLVAVEVVKLRAVLFYALKLIPQIFSIGKVTNSFVALLGAVTKRLIISQRSSPSRSQVRS